MFETDLTVAYTREEIVEIVKMIRLNLYNKGLHCCARVIKKEMEKENVKPLPSESTIGRILSRHGLTHGRIGFLNNPV
jgi:putative transposase